MQTSYPIEHVAGLPCLTEDLMWRDDVPLFVTGRLAGLRLGPGAPNLVGARIGAERIAWNVEEVLGKLGRLRAGRQVTAGEEEDDDVDGSSSGRRLEEYAAARNNRFGSLAGCEE